ncbi:hypothetical protein GUJ93_ZPchr0013g36087 [Zizania palustris]|uniref:Dof zinc finger protein n=1 Tax=Zizania palustris TaxID=103762 RepID=A0A8J5X295_ZIZPA|nr:hypothetical protein GUJ93_ZPchr0013g36087 [Zizania palustris]
MAIAAGILPVSGGATRSIGGSSARPVSMAERARMAKIPQPEPGLKCPRCNSTNTKFCYFNNYSLYQPRHFCKTCRRYWTRGGALRNVPEGGGCRRNKRSSKCYKKPASSSTTSARTAGGGPKASATCVASSSAAAAALMPQQLHLPFCSLHAHHSSCNGINGGAASRLGLTELTSPHPAAVGVDYRLGEGHGLERPGLPPVQQFPFITRANTAVPPPPPGLPPLMPDGISYPFGDVEAAGLTDVAAADSAGLITHMASVKTDNPPSAGSSREFLGLSGSFQLCGDSDCGGYGTGGSAVTGGAWADLPAFDLSTYGNIL